MRILIANDDGVYSPGLRTLAEVAEEFGEVRVVAPDVEMSSAGHSITATRPLSYKRTQLGELDAWRVNGTPADCVALGAFHWQNVDVVLSGINLGTNLGNAMWHSGTLAAAKQAALLGMRGIALSMPAAEEPDFSAARVSVRQVLEVLLSEPGLPLVNVNVPAGPASGIRWTRQSIRHYDGRVVQAEDPMRRAVYWFTVVPLEAAEEGTDRWALERGYVSMTPLRLDLTDHTRLAEVQGRDLAL